MADTRLVHIYISHHNYSFLHGFLHSFGVYIQYISRSFAYSPYVYIAVVTGHFFKRKWIQVHFIATYIRQKSQRAKSANQMNEFVCSLLIGYKYEFLRPPALRCYDVFVKLMMMMVDISSQRMIEWKFYLYCWCRTR